MKHRKEEKECTFNPDTSRTRRRNEILYEKKQTRCKSNESHRKNLTNSRSLKQLEKMTFQEITRNDFNTMSEESRLKSIIKNEFQSINIK